MNQHNKDYTGDLVEFLQCIYKDVPDLYTIMYITQIPALSKEIHAKLIAGDGRNVFMSSEKRLGTDIKKLRKAVIRDYIRPLLTAWKHSRMYNKGYTCKILKITEPVYDGLKQLYLNTKWISLSIRYKVRTRCIQGSSDNVVKMRVRSMPSTARTSFGCDTPKICPYSSGEDTDYSPPGGVALFHGDILVNKLTDETLSRTNSPSPYENLSNSNSFGSMDSSESPDDTPKRIKRKNRKRGGGKKKKPITENSVSFISELSDFPSLRFVKIYVPIAIIYASIITYTLCYSS
jgi:hypothetical protein